MWKFFWYIEFVWMSDELRINEKEYENDINCKDCYEMNKWFLGVSVILIILVIELYLVRNSIKYLYWIWGMK